MQLKNVTLITGGARSGKSQLAESLALEAGLPVVYVATMQEVASDGESVTRIAQHKRRRPKEWKTLEVPFALYGPLRDLEKGPRVCVVDCLSLYVSNILLTRGLDDGFEELHQIIVEDCGRIIESMGARKDVTFFLVTNEVGWGVVPENALARAYRDLLGWTNQLFAAHAAEVYLMCAGIPMKVKGE